MKPVYIRSSVTAAGVLTFANVLLLVVMVMIYQCARQQNQKETYVTQASFLSTSGLNSKIIGDSMNKFYQLRQHHIGDTDVTVVSYSSNINFGSHGICQLDQHDNVYTDINN